MTDIQHITEDEALGPLTLNLFDARGSKLVRTTVPCNGCRACCLHDAIFLHPECGDDPDAYETELVEYPIMVNGRRIKAPALKHKPDGSCVYLGPHGCTIHDRAPAICKEFDCRRLYQSMTRAERRRRVRQGVLDKAVLDAGRDRLNTL